MKYVFVLGRNIELSIAEVLNFLKRFDNPAKNSIQNKNALLVEVNKKLEKNAIDKLGGVIAIGEVIDNPENEILYHGTKNNINYVLWDFSNKIEKFEDYLKKRFKEEKLKAARKPLTGSIDSQGGKKFSMIGSKLIDEQYFAFNNYFGRIIQSCDYDSIEKRDMEKPVRREELAISPRLCKIMINLSQVKKGKMIDPFCGIGVVLYEALLQGVDVFGVDVDAEAIEGAKKNLEWGGFSKDNYNVIKSDSRNADMPKAEVVVTEPDLGKILRRIPKQEEIDKTLKNFEELMIDVLNNLKRNVSGRIVFSAPKIGKNSCDIERILSGTGLKLAEGPFLEFRKKSVVKREIFVLGK